MYLNKEQFTALIKGFKFKELFNELGWDAVTKTEVVPVNNETYNLAAAAEKRNFMIFVCSPEKNGKIPAADVRKKIDNKVTRLFYEHLIIYADKGNTEQIWQLVIREANKPITVRETHFHTRQYPELLIQKLNGLFFSIDEEENISLIDVINRVQEQYNTNSEKVTKKFYTEFKQQYSAFLKFISGIEKTVDNEWYASLMLNRLMFIYFLQKKGFLDNNINYLNDKLKETKKNKGINKFYSFYRDFLLVLFHNGLGAPENERTQKINKEIGRIPYLNGGLFDVHQLEKDNKNIEIPDKAFEKIFNFFDEYNWHLDTRITASGKDINPDVIGYIFEKYINDRAAMGAYYTKEDITEYVSKNTIIPYLFDQIKKECAVALKDESSLWLMLKENPDRYIYDAVKHGIYENSSTDGKCLKIRELPQEIKIGIDTTKPNLLERRKEWNKTAPSEFGLPTETWREVIERRNRYFEILRKIESDEIRDINDFITYNLNIRQFAQDAVTQYEGSDFITAFYKAITKITILDPTCGSGAFLFAALNILEPLYEACIQRMREFVEEDNKGKGKKHSQFRTILAEIQVHHNEKYYIYKSIILNNLHGVDIMNEAVEIAKLRLFLKLIAEVDKFEQIEPLPDIDFNIRVGNTLIGYATEDELKKGLTWSLNIGADTKKVYEEMTIVAKVFQRYKEIQLENNKHEGFKEAKDALNERLKNLNITLNDYLGNDYGKSRKKKSDFEKWLNDYKPFHWFAEFYEIIQNGGFDVIIGNPPYVEYSKIRKMYEVKGSTTISCGNLFPMITEKIYTLLKIKRRMGLVLQHSAFCTPRMEPLMKLVRSKSEHAYISYYECRPGKLFDGLDVRIAIVLAKPGDKFQYFSSKYHRFFTSERESLFNLLYYSNSTTVLQPYSFLKLGTQSEVSIAEKMFKLKERIGHYVAEKSNRVIYYSYGYRYWAKVQNNKPFFEGESSDVSTGEKHLYLRQDVSPNVFASLLMSSLFYWYYSVYSDGHNFTKTVIYDFPFRYIENNLTNKLSSQFDYLMSDLELNAEIRSANYKSTGKIQYLEFYAYKSKNFIDNIDKILAAYYNLTEEELDFIINYDIKYRMSKDLDQI